MATWRDAGSHEFSHIGTPATIGRADYKALRAQMESCGMSFVFGVEDVSVHPRASDLSFCNELTNTARAPDSTAYLTSCTRVQPLIHFRSGAFADSDA